MAILTCMSHHVYTFGGKLYLQQSGGPIGLRFTACLASAIMKIWDEAWLDLLEKNKMTPIIYKRYVDDSRNLTFPIAEGWRWNGEKFSFDERTFLSDKEKGTAEHDQIRTSQELTKAMNSLVYFLKFTHEDYTQFENKRRSRTEPYKQTQRCRHHHYMRVWSKKSKEECSIVIKLPTQRIEQIFCQSLHKKSSTRDIV